MYRHSSGMGTVMEFNDGVDRKVLVLDAVHRSPGNLQFGTYEKDIELQNYKICPGTGREYVYLNTANNKDITNVTAAASITDTWINANVVKDAKTAKENCDVWMTYNNQTDSEMIRGVPAVAYCRSIQVNGVPCDLPNIQTLARIYCEANALDAMDPTVEANLTRALGTKNRQGAWYIGVNQGSYPYNYYSWSSTEYNLFSCWCVDYGGYVYFGGKRAGFSVIPVLEL